MLTHVHNRASILGLLEAELEREPGTGTAVVYVDLGQFKPVNDSLGHAAGDELLALVAERLKLASRDSDVVGRLGGDEFLIILREVPSAQVAMRVAERISASICSDFTLSCGRAELGVSIGVACGRAGEISAEELVRRADSATYRCKEHGEVRPGARRGRVGPRRPDRRAR